MKEYIGKYRGHIVGICVFVLLMHGTKLDSVVIGIDTEAAVRQQAAFYGGWLSIGRQGLVFMKCLLGCVGFNPYFSGMMTLVLLSASVLAMLFFWDRLSGGVSIWGWLACGFLWIAHPVLTEQFYFSLQSMEICIAMLLTVLALYLTVEAGERRRPELYAVSGALLVITFSSYQVFAAMYIFGAVSVLILQVLGGSEQKPAHPVRCVAPWFCVFMAAFLCNSLITALFFRGSEYLSAQIVWRQAGVKGGLRNILFHVLQTLTGYDSLYNSLSYGALCLAGLLLAFALRREYGWLLLFYYIALMGAPFVMTVVCGGRPAVRSQLVLPPATGFAAYLDILMLGKLQRGGALLKKAACGLLGLACAAGIWTEAQVTKSLYYTDACRYAQDEALGRELIERLAPLIGEDDIYVAVLGRIPFRGNNSCVQGETVGRSVFDHDTDVEPKYYWSTGRVTGFLHTLGYDCEQALPGQMPYALDFARELPVWPEEGCVARAGDMVVIKLSDY